MDSDAADGLKAIFLGNRAALLRFLTARLRDATKAEDILQDVWIKLEDVVPAGPIAEPLAYLYRIAENVARDRQRSSSRRRVREERWVNEGAYAAEGREEALSPERRAIARDRLRRIEARLAELPERTRYVFGAFRLDGRAQKDIAEELGVSLSAVEKHLQRVYKIIIDARREDDAELPMERRLTIE